MNYDFFGHLRIFPFSQGLFDEDILEIFLEDV
jgi:hypothetical protein